MSQFKIRAAGKSDRQAIVDILNELFEADVAARFDELYLGNPHGEARSWLAFSEASEEPVAITSIFPRDVWVDGQIRSGSIGGDCYVRPAARRMGLATKLHRACIGDMADQGVEFMYGPPWANNLKALVKAGSKEIAKYSCHSRGVSMRFMVECLQSMLPNRLVSSLGDALLTAMAKLPYWMLERIRTSYDATCVLEPIDRFDAEWDEFQSRALKTHSVCCVRDSTYMNWRHVDHARANRNCYVARRNGDLIGMLVMDRQEENLFIVDFLAARNTNDLGQLLRLALDRGIEEQADRVQIETIVTRQLRKSLWRLGFTSKVNRGFQVACDSADEQSRELFDFDAWHFAFCDQDPRPIQP